MCGRFVSASPPDEIARYFGATDPVETVLDPSYNVAPTDDVYAVLESGRVRRLAILHWGLVPPWAKSRSVGSRMINARAETLTTKNAFRPALEKRRCIIPADGFYEWKAVPGQKKKQPMLIRRTDGEPLAFAGLWEIWRNRETPDAEPLRSCTIITTAANDDLSAVHDRMPVILPAGAWSTWLDEGCDDVDALGALLVPAAPKVVELQPVSTEVNDVRNNGAQLIERDDPEGEEHSQGILL